MAGLRSVLVPRLLGQDLVLIGVLSLVLGALGSVYPAWRAVRIKPLDALRRGT
jgi:ABC-type lipoprotein release transport system permease subunit